jgi:hypothetical protein
MAPSCFGQYQQRASDGRERHGLASRVWVHPDDQKQSTGYSIAALLFDQVVGVVVGVVVAPVAVVSQSVIVVRVVVV